MHVPRTSKVKLLDTKRLRLYWDSHFSISFMYVKYWTAIGFWTTCAVTDHYGGCPTSNASCNPSSVILVSCTAWENDFRGGLRGEIMCTAHNGTYQLQQLQFCSPYRRQVLVGYLSESGSKWSFVMLFDVGFLKVVAFVLSLSSP